MARTKNKYIRDNFDHIIGEVEVKDDNPYNVLREEEDGKGKETTPIPNPPMATKEWVNKTFGKSNEKMSQNVEKHEEKDLNPKETLDTKQDTPHKGNNNTGVEEDKVLKGAIVVYTGNSEVMTPLAIQGDQSQEPEGENQWNREE